MKKVRQTAAVDAMVEAIEELEDDPTNEAIAVAAVEVVKTMQDASGVKIVRDVAG